MTSILLPLTLGIIAILLMIVANGFFVAQEFAYMSVDRVKLASRAKDGDTAAQQALKVTNRTTFMLSGAQLGITVTGLLVGYIAEPLVGESIAQLLGGVAIAPETALLIGTTLALVVATVVQMIFGELYPKNLAVANPEPLAKVLAQPTLVYLAVFGWLITIFDYSANLLLRLVRLDPVSDLDTTATAHDLEHIVADSQQSGDLSKELCLFIDRVLDFPHRTIEHAMIPRAMVDTVTENTTVGELRQLMRDAHSRYPVTSADNSPVGIVTLRDLLSHREVEDSTPVHQIMQPVHLLPELMPLPDAVSSMTQSGEQLACVLDEYGGFCGILSFEDISAEILGDIGDEHDPTAPPLLISLQPNVWTVHGQVPLDELERSLGLVLGPGDYDTVSGLLIAHAGQLPQVGDQVRILVPATIGEVIRDHQVERELIFKVLSIQRHVAKEVSVELIEHVLDGSVESEADQETES